MKKNRKIFGLQWYDVKTKFKQLLRKVAYSWLFQQLICYIFLIYMKFVYLTSKKQIINNELFLECIKNNTPLIISFWHNRLMMTPFVTIEPKKLYPKFNLITLASRHGDGKFVGKVMEKFGLIAIYGSSRDGRKASRGIEIGDLKKIIKGLKNGLFLGISPDGPRGPNQKINGEVVNIARLTGAKILPFSYSTSKSKRLNSWDKFFIPLPFSKMCFYFDDQLIEVAKKAEEEEIEKIKENLEERMNLVQNKSEELSLQR